VPPDVARILRAEVGFGCAVCGCPILEYHHIIPWAEHNHYEVEHMVALCRNHHQEIGKQNKKVAYAAKKTPFNIRHKRFKGYLVTNKENQAFVLGNTRFVGFSNAVSYFGVPLFGHSVEEGEIRVNCFIPDANFFPEIEVTANNIVAIIDDFWDIEFKSNYIKFRRKKGEVFLSLDFRKDDVEVRGRFELEGREYRFSPKRCDFGGARIENLTLSGHPGQTAIGHGHGDMKLLRPNYAMRTPRPTFIHR
jgi:hypothetical protein